MAFNIDQRIKESARHFADQIKQAAQRARSEEDIRHAFNTFIDKFIAEFDLKVEGWHEYGLAKGRIDSKYGGVFIEFKDPHGSGKLSDQRESAGVQAVVEQINNRFKDFQLSEKIPNERLLGIGTDGNYIIFVRQQRSDISDFTLMPITNYSIEKLLGAFLSVGAKGTAFTPENLAQDFGADSNVTQNGIRRLYDVIVNTNNPKALTFFHQWEIFFGEVCGFNVKATNSKIRTLAKHYMVSDSHPAELLFSVHTYYALFIKLLAAEIVETFSSIGISPLKKLANAPTPEKQREELFNLEQGGIWNRIGIKNFLEGDLFSWYLDAWDERCSQVVYDMVRQFEKYDVTTLSVEPTESRDLLKQLYQQLFPRSVRHDLGEYYTPDWLAELVLNELEYDGNPDKRLLDPACGSGIFLVMAINRVKSWFEEHRFECGFDEAELLKKISRNIIGFDLNPLAVMAARTNYLLGLRDLLRESGGVELPVYLCDSIMTPSEYGELWSGGLGKAKRLSTSVGQFVIPLEITNSRDQIGIYADCLEFCIRNKYSNEDFLKYLASNALPISEKNIHVELYEKLRELDTANQNGIWARIIKNAFAPLFVGTFDFVTGNPPWVNWENLPDEYRKDMMRLWKHYDLFTLSGTEGRLGGGKKDLSMIMTYSAADNYLADKGKLGFVITQTVFKTKGAGDGFRQFTFKDIEGRRFYLKPLEVHDFSAMQVFEGATNRTAVFICFKQEKKFTYPVSYTVWRGASRLKTDVSFDKVTTLTNHSNLKAHPVDRLKRSSPWLTAPNRALKGIQKILGKSFYKAYAGCCTWLNGVYWINIRNKLPSGELLIENLYNVGKIKVREVYDVIEPDLVYPLMRGRDVKRWCAQPSTYIILPNRTDKLAGLPDETMKIRYPKTYAYLKQFEGDPDKPESGTLRGRSGFKKYFKPTDPFYSIYNVGPYTMAKWKVMWREQSSFFQATNGDPASGKIIVPDHKLMMVPCTTKEEAGFLAGMLNSSPSVLTIHSYVLSTSTSTHVLGNVAIPKYDALDKDHINLSGLASQVISFYSAGESEKAQDLIAEIDRLAAKLWGITSDELIAIQEGLIEMTGSSVDNSQEDKEVEDE